MPGSSDTRVFREQNEATDSPFQRGKESLFHISPSQIVTHQCHRHIRLRSPW